MSSEAYPYYDTPRSDILRMIPLDGPTIGSVGCGWAATERVLVEKGRVVHGVDVSKEAVAVAAGRLRSARVVQRDEQHFFDDDTLDGLILADVLEHMPNAWAALATMARSVRQGGWVVISVPNMQSLNVLIQFVLLGDWPEKELGIFDKTHIQMMSRRRLVRWCRAAGLEPVEWFDRYESHWRGRLIGVFDKLTLGLFHDWLTYEWQCVCRKRPRVAG
jgi:2-polyprenyl-3-methyl-5-hydroxy-6-metoxy-1,4-benzoquinol methylase